MPQKAETKFSERLHKGLPKELYVEKTHNPLRYGVPDFYYEGVRDLFAEHKWINKPIDRDVEALDLSAIFKSKSWRQQYEWLMRRHRNKHLARLFIGHPEGCHVLLPPFDFKVGAPGTDFTLVQARNHLVSIVMLKP